MFSEQQLQTILFLCKEHLAVRGFIAALIPQFEPGVELEANIGLIPAVIATEIQKRQNEAANARAAKMVEDQKASAPANGEAVKTP